MDYTTIARLKAAIGNATTTDDAVLAQYITAASREIDRRVAGNGHADIFKLEDIADEVVRGWIDADGRVVCYPFKAAVNSVTDFAYRASPLNSWTSVDANDLSIDGFQIVAWVDAVALRGRKSIQVQVSYNGGLAAAADGLPADLIEAATVLAVRFYREAKTGLSDSVGVAELGMLTYTKALPVRVREIIEQYQRVVP